MKVYAWKSATGNFGDDLNDWLWGALIQDPWPEDEGILLCGVGTILTSELPKAKRNIIFGSGAGYGTLPNFLHFDNVTCYGVRGPLTAKLCGFSESKVLADPAILIPDILSRPESTHGPIFVPHVHSAVRADWSKICALAEIEYVDPRNESKSVIQRIAGASLVLAESMHAAIIADAYRVPWIPVWSSREISYFKWLDWAMSVGAKVNPQFIGAPSRMAAIDDVFATLAINNNARCLGVSPDGTVADPEAVVAHLQKLINWRATKLAKFSRKNYLRARKRLLMPIAGYLGENPVAANKIAAQLRVLAQQPGSLSDDNSVAAAKARLYGALEELKQDLQLMHPSAV